MEQQLLMEEQFEIKSKIVYKIISENFDKIIPYFLKYGIKKETLIRNILEKTDNQIIKDLNPLATSFYICFQAYNYHKKNSSEIMTRFYDQFIMELNLEYLESKENYILDKKDQIFIENVFEAMIDYD